MVVVVRSSAAGLLVAAAFALGSACGGSTASTGSGTAGSGGRQPSAVGGTGGVGGSGGASGSGAGSGNGATGGVIDGGECVVNDVRECTGWNGCPSQEICWNGSWAGCSCSFCSAALIGSGCTLTVPAEKLPYMNHA